MKLRLLDQLSLPGDPAKPNEDCFAQNDAAALVMDGATMLDDPLMPGPSDAAWIAQFGARRLMAHLQDKEPKKALRSAMADAEKSFQALRRREMEEPWQLPCASMMLAADAGARLPLRAKPGKGEVAVAGSPASENRRGLEFIWLGDCGAIVAQGGDVTVIGETMEKRAEESRRAAKLGKEKKISPALALSRQEMLAHIRAARARVNSGDYWLFSPDKRAAAQARRRMVATAPGALLLLASDGFLALAVNYGVYDTAGLIAAAKSKGLAAMGEELRAIENGDAGGDRFARFKKSDDATALLLEVIS